MDLKNLKPKSNTVTVKLYHPVELEDLGLEIELYAPHSEEYRAIQHEHQDRRISKVSRSGGKRHAKKDIGVTMAEIEADSIDLMARTTIKWNLTYEEKPLKLSVDTAKEVYKEYFWIKDQIEEAWSNSLDFTVT